MANYLIGTSVRDVYITDVLPGKDPDVFINHQNSLVNDDTIWDIANVLFPVRPEGGITILKRPDFSYVTE